MLRQTIISCYQNAVALSDVPQELKQSLKTKERVPAFIDNLTRELALVPKLDMDRIQTVVYDMTFIFLDAVKRKADENYISENAKRAMTDKADSDAKMNELADRINSAPENAPAEIDIEELL